MQSQLLELSVQLLMISAKNIKNRFFFFPEGNKLIHCLKKSDYRRISKHGETSIEM